MRRLCCIVVLLVALVQPHVADAAPPPPTGYVLAATSGELLSFGAAPPLRIGGGSDIAPVFTAPVVAFEQAVGDLRAGWLLTAAGHVFTVEIDDGGCRCTAHARYHGSPAQEGRRVDAVGMASTGDGHESGVDFGLGYWIVASNGAVHAYGDAAPYGDLAAASLNRPIVGIEPTPVAPADGYWLVAGDGGVFTFGAAVFHGSAGDLRLNRPVVGMATTRTGNGYWLVASDGGVLTFGDAGFFGSLGGTRLRQPIIGIKATSTGRGYWLFGRDGGVFAFGDAGFAGSAPGAGRTVVVGGAAATG